MATKKKKKTTRRKSSEPTPEEVWTKMKEEIGVEDMGKYSMKESFAVQTAIDHPKFGIGFVIESENNKIRVAFQEGEKYLVHNRE